MSHPFLISPEDLDAALGKPGLKVVDASWYLPARKRFPRPEFEAGHIPGAVFFDQDEIVDPDSTLPHTLPPAEVFAQAAGRLGLSNTDTIVVYDGAGLIAAPRVWWMLRVFGARDVRILDGGLPAWTAFGGTIETGEANPAPAEFEAKLDESAVVFLPEMRGIVEGGTTQIADARARGRFTAEEPEPRAGLRGGHMPGASSLPVSELVERGRLKSPDELRQAFAKAGLDTQAPMVTSCGSGVTAAVINFALASLGGEARLYDGSWTEWASADGTPVETGPANRT